MSECSTGTLECFHHGVYSHLKRSTSQDEEEIMCIVLLQGVAMTLKDALMALVNPCISSTPSVPK